ncbi:hypothetical protein KJ039_05750 [bacterium]|nr:hypothetical protein [bacterium]
MPLVNRWKDKEGIANIYGVVLYTDAHAHIKKILADSDYWTALDEISGPRWAIFSVRAKAGFYEMPSPPPGMICMMIRVWKEPHENKLLLKEFEIESTEKLPQLLIFAEGENGEILKETIRLDDSAPEKAYESLKNGIKVVSEAIRNVSPENLKSAEGVYAAVNLSISNYKQWQRIKKGISFVKWIKELLP